MEQIRSPLARARGLGSAKHGVGHWRVQRLSAVALVPLTFWFVASLATHTGSGYDAAIAWIGSPLVAVLLSLYLAVAFYHSQLGLQVIVEDYVHGEGLKTVMLTLLQFLHIGLAVGSIFAVLWIALGAAA
ncbi:succinate dehydrogenase, hydrophobic membrane anchor protein [Spectribacter hydrogenoxidans]|uniref:Succinate dehydrogenase hydrophobic membrane anchor subunit n=1 Tax=Spectribacter hydrogenoxidans TaxID=3075608 RepID=A0ABU3C2R3_9GAMM|nr:succinate dehydrogenase, hydrophobic membrane anchor protein [Salinisphaera sp. W335]MDT0635846.1 succinate dehydrogenase, hydrophobic membrane anchor protein [Salinisphaera sp. W335]